jgi:hypothetical protein
MRCLRYSLFILAAVLGLLRSIALGQTPDALLFSDQKQIIRYGIQEVWNENGRSDIWQVSPGNVCCRGEDTLELGNVWIFTGLVDASEFHRGRFRVTGEVKPSENNRPVLIFGVTADKKAKVVGGYALLLCEKKNTGTILAYSDFTVQEKGFRVLHVPQGRPGFPEIEDEWVPFCVTIDGPQVRYEAGGTTITDVTIKEIDSRGYVGVHCLYDHPKYPPAQVLLRNLTIENP